MSRLDLHNQRVVEDYESKWLDPDYNFFGIESTKVDMEIEKYKEEYTLSDEEVEQLKRECESDDFKHLDKYDWAEILEEFTGERIRTEDIVSIDLNTNTIAYMKL